MHICADCYNQVPYFAAHLCSCFSLWFWFGLSVVAPVLLLLPDFGAHAPPTSDPYVYILRFFPSLFPRLLLLTLSDALWLCFVTLIDGLSF